MLIIKDVVEVGHLIYVGGTIDVEVAYDGGKEDLSQDDLDQIEEAICSIIDMLDHITIYELNNKKHTEFIDLYSERTIGIEKSYNLLMDINNIIIGIMKEMHLTIPRYIKSTRGKVSLSVYPTYMDVMKIKVSEGIENE